MTSSHHGQAPPDLDDIALSMLVDQARQGDDEAQAALCEHFRPQLSRLARARGVDEPEGLADEVLTRVVGRLDRLNTRTIEVFRAYLFRSARNAISNDRKSAARRLKVVPLHPGDAATLPSASDGPEDLVGADDWFDSVAAELTDAQREVIELRFKDDLSVAETAEALRVHPIAVKSLQRRALLTLRAVVAAVAIIAAVWFAAGRTSPNATPIDSGLFAPADAEDPDGDDLVDDDQTSRIEAADDESSLRAAEEAPVDAEFTPASAPEQLPGSEADVALSENSGGGAAVDRLDSRPGDAGVGDAAVTGPGGAGSISVGSQPSASNPLTSPGTDTGEARVPSDDGDTSGGGTGDEVVYDGPGGSARCQADECRITVTGEQGTDGSQRGLTVTGESGSNVGSYPDWAAEFGEGEAPEWPDGSAIPEPDGFGPPGDFEERAEGPGNATTQMGLPGAGGNDLPDWVLRLVDPPEDATAEPSLGLPADGEQGSPTVPVVPEPPVDVAAQPPAPQSPAAQAPSPQAPATQAPVPERPAPAPGLPPVSVPEAVDTEPPLQPAAELPSAAPDGSLAPQADPPPDADFPDLDDLQSDAPPAPAGLDPSPPPPPDAAPQVSTRTESSTGSGAGDLPTDLDAALEEFTQP